MTRTIPFTRVTLLTVDMNTNMVSEATHDITGIVKDSKIKKMFPNTIIKSVDVLQQSYELDDDVFLQYATKVGEPTKFVGRERKTKDDE